MKTTFSALNRAWWVAFFAAVILISFGCGEKVEFKKTEVPAVLPSGRDLPSGPAPESGNPNPATDRGPMSEPEAPVNSPAAPTAPPPQEQAEANPVPRELPAARPVVIPDGRRLTVRLLETVSSKTASPGERFDAELASPLVLGGVTVLPKGTPMRGHVVAARSSGRLHHPGYLRLTLDSLRTRDGRWVRINTTSVSAKGKSHKKRNIALIGGGTGVGAVIGAIAGGGKGAAIGALSGAGAGTAGAYATGKKDVAFPVERRLSFLTTRSIPIG